MYVTLVLSEKAKAETQFIQQLKVMADRIPVSTHLILLCMLHKACYVCYISSLRESQGRNPVHTTVEGHGR